MSEHVDNKGKSRGARSPRYPGIGLESAIMRVERVFEREYQTPCSQEVVVSNMGYGSLSGAARTVLSALMKYGLLDRNGEEIAVSDRAVAIIVNKPSSPERIKAIQEAANEPDLFKELDDRFNNGLASDDNIVSFLLMRKFTRDAAHKAVNAYRETKNLVKSEGAESVDYENKILLGEMPSEGTKPWDSTFADNKKLESSGPDSNDSIPPKGSEFQPPAGTRRMIYALDEGDVSIQFPEKMSRESVEDLKSYVKIFLRKIERQTNDISDMQISEEGKADSKFSHVGAWELDGNSIIAHGQLYSDQCLYAFVINNEVVYIGHTERAIEDRMRNIRYAEPSQETNVRVKAEIIKALEAGKQVKIHAHVPTEGSNLRVLKEQFIQEIQPAWNIMYK